jgi:phosphotransferase system enzyme I (PtsI)
VLQLIAMSIAAADKAGIPVSVCGEMAGDASLTRLLLGFGLRQFSMHPAHVLTVKQQILKSDLPHITSVAQKMLKAHEPEKLHQLLARLNA